MKGPSCGVPLALFWGLLVFGYISAESEKDFEFAGDKDVSFRDDEDFLADQEGSGEIEGSGDVLVTGRPTGIPGLYRAVINITSSQYTDEILAAGRDISRLPITLQIQSALQNVLGSLGGTIMIQVVDLEPSWWLMATFDINTDGSQSEEDMAMELKRMLNTGTLGSYRVSSEGFDFRKIRDAYTCPPSVGPEPESLPSRFPSNQAYLMINQAFSCDGFVTAWNFVRQRNEESVYIGVFRPSSDTSYALVDSTFIQPGTYGRQELTTPMLVRKGDFIGVFYDKSSRGGSLSYVSKADSGDNALKYLLYQTYKVPIYAEDLLNGAPFEMSDYGSVEDQVLFAVQADMSYQNVPVVTTPAPQKCQADEWTCQNGDCIPSSYYCDGQRDCYDGSDEDNCVADRLTCSESEFRCGNGQQCIPVQFVCNSVNDCGDNSDENECGPSPVTITSYRDGSEPREYTVSWLVGTDDISSYTIKYRQVTIRSGQLTSDGNYIIERALTDAWTSLTVTAQTAQTVISDLTPGSYYQVEISAFNNIGSSEPRAFVFKTANDGCRPGQWQCNDGGCIDLIDRCNNIPDCQDDSDEICDFGKVCVEGLTSCPQPDGTVICVEDNIGCVEICAENEIQCLDGKGCFQLYGLCDGRIDCRDLSDEANCECLEGEFQCVQDRNCIAGNLRCDGRSDCADQSDELNCPCPDGYFQCLNTPSQECISSSLKCDGTTDCSDGSDEVNCGCTENQWQCADKSCVPSSMRCDGLAQCEDLSDEVKCGCTSSQFTCADESCVPDSMRCDGTPQCEDESDEDNCPCREGMYQCVDGNCVEGRMRCDGIPQCEDGSDEIGCPTEPPSCPTRDFQCTTAERLECIDKRLQCDGYPDCSDGSDENGCPGCRRDEFTCRSDGACVPSDSKCNGVIDCADKSDELDCVCTQNQFRCGDGICIDLSRRCDRQVDCDDQSDEIACPCRSGEFQCVNGDCINEGRRCDGRADCADRSDEQGCPQRRRCQEGFYQCGTGHCLSESRRCDGYPDCPDQSDEQDCPLRCRQGEMECPIDNKCLTPDQICNRVYDCADGRDERPCERCTSDEFECESDRSCISSAGRCNGRKECSDGSDEMNCPTLPPISVDVSPRNLKIREGAEALITCMAQGLPAGARVEWFRGTEGLPMQSAVELGKLMIPVAKVMDSGVYTCRVVGIPGNFQSSARLEVVAYGPTPSPPDPDGSCGRDEAVCQNGQCIRREYRCDGENDCADGSDEPADCFANLCEPNEHRCPSGQCIMKIWRCDGESDCDDGSDERNCETKSPEDACAPDEFKCVSGDQCVPLAYQCDQEIDCLDRSDEIGCSKPVIIVPPVAEIEVELGGTFTIICEAVGVPTPLIVWRLNWGNIPTGERITVVSQNGRGQLTVTNAVYEDAGAYTCEAVNNRGSIFAIPDALVIVRLILTESRHHIQENILVIGGTDYIQLNSERSFVTLGVSSQCNKDLNLTMVGPRLYAECEGRETKVEIAYVGQSAVNLEIVKRIILIEVRGDVLPETEKDMVIVHTGGLPKSVITEEEHMQVITGIGTLDSMTERRSIVIGGRKRNSYRPEKQIIHVGVTVNCFGNLSLSDHANGRKALKCLNNESQVMNTADQHSVVIGKNATVVKTAPEVIYIAGKVPQKKRKKLSRVIGRTHVQDKEDRFVSFEGHIVSRGESPDIVETDKTSIPQGVEHEVIMISNEQHSVVPETRNVEVVLTGSRAATVSVGDKDLSRKIVGRIFEISGASNVYAKDEEKYVEIGAGQVCMNKINVQLIGSAVVCQCEKRNITLDYIGQGPTDIEVLYKEYMVEGDTEWTNYQSQDHILMYIGGIPANLKNKATTSYVVRGVSPRRETSDRRLKKERVVEIMGGGQNVSWTKRQVIVVGVSRKCEDLLETSVVRGKNVVECSAASKVDITVVGNSGDQVVMEEVVGGESGPKRTELRKEILLRGHSPDIGNNIVEEVISDVTSPTDILEPIVEHIDERILIVGGTDKVDVDNSNQKVHVGFSRQGCLNSNAYRVLSEDNNLLIDCQRRWTPINVVFIGNSTTDIYLSKTFVEDRNQKDVSLYFGGLSNVSESERSVVEIIRNVGTGHRSGIRKVMTFGGQSSNEKSQKINVQVGFSTGCPGRLLKEESYGRIFITCRVVGGQVREIISDTRMENAVEVIGKSPVPEITENEQIIVVSGRKPATENMEETDIVEVIHKGDDNQMKTVHNEIVIRGGTAGMETVKNSEILVRGGSSNSESMMNSTMVVSGGPGVRETVNNSEIVVTGGMGKSDSVINREIVVTGGSTQENMNTVFQNETREAILIVEPLETTRAPVTEEPVQAILIVEPVEKITEKKKIDLVGSQVEVVKTTTTTEQPSSTYGIRAMDVEINTPKFQIRQRETEMVHLAGKVQMGKTSTPQPDIAVGVIDNKHFTDRPDIAISNERKFTNTTLSKDVQNIFLIGQVDYVNVNESGQNFNVGFSNECGADFNVIVNGRHLKVICKQHMNAIEFVYVGEEDTEFEVNTNVIYKTFTGSGVKQDSVFIQLGGLVAHGTSRQNNIRSLYVNVSAQDSLFQEKSFTISSHNEIIDENNIEKVKVVEIGIKRSCSGDGIGKYVNDEGTVVFCHRRADILPEENGYGVESSGSETIDHVRLMSQKTVVHPVSELTVMSGEFSEVEHSKHNDGLAVSAHSVVIETTHNNNNNIDDKSNSVEMDLETYDNTNAHRRGDVPIEEMYGSDISATENSGHSNDMPYRQYTDSSKNLHFGSGDDTNSKIIHYDIERNKSVKIDVGDNCKGTIEAMEVEDGVIVKCTVGGENVQLNLVGFKRIESGKEVDLSKYQHDDPNSNKLDKNGNYLTGREVVVPGSSEKNLTITEVYYASKRRFIEKLRRHRRSAIAEEVGQEWSNGIKYKVMNPELAKPQRVTHTTEKPDIQRNRHRQVETSNDHLQKDLSKQALDFYSRHKARTHSVPKPTGFVGQVGRKIKSMKGRLLRRHPSSLHGKNDRIILDGPVSKLTDLSFSHYNNERTHSQRLGRHARSDVSLAGDGPSDLYFGDGPGDLYFDKRGLLFDNVDHKQENSVYIQTQVSDNDIRKSIVDTKIDSRFKKRVSYDVYKKLLKRVNTQNQQPVHQIIINEAQTNTAGLTVGLDKKGQTKHNIESGFDKVEKADVYIRSGWQGGQKSLCPPPFFNFGATVTDDCVRCFCFGQSVQCFSSDLQVSKIALSNTLQFVRRDSDGTRTPVDETLVNYRQRTAEYQVRDMTRVLPQGKYYWSMPREFLGERLTSYGGELKYTIFYDIQGRTSATTSDVDVIIGGNGIELYYRARTVPSVGVPTSISVPLIESSWERSDGTRRRGDTPVDSQYAIREDFMTVLQNVEYILIRGTYDRDQSTSRIGGLFLTTAVDYPTEYGQAYLVEKCECPTGYTGLSCQNCAPGFSRDTRGGQCVSCNCNGHSNDCDRATGQCLNCRHNTEGPQCQLCAAGYYGDARRGTSNDCQPCPCPLSVPSNQFSRSCYLASDNEVTCANCPVGFEGRRCERCAEGYTGDPMTIGSTCQKGPDDYYCDPRGSLTATPNPLTGRCSCKENVYGDKCDTCKASNFYLSNLYELGCVRCFCMGVSTLCQSTSWSRVQVGLPLNGDNSGVKLTDSSGNALRDQRLTLSSGRRELVYRTRDANEDMLYWTLPSVFLGDKVTAYGGSFRFTVRYTSRQGVAISNAEPLVKLSGNDINLIYRSRQEMQPDRPQSVNIIMYEQNWYRSDGQPATREHLLMALADLNAILIRATFERPQLETAIRDITLDIAENRQTRQDRAYAVESCQCPVGYRGLSCEDCDTGYTRSGGGLYLGLCEPCNCNGHSNECDPETGVCRNCQHNTEGDSCELCAVGYYGDSTSGRRDACQKCPCPLTEAPNQFSPRCRLDTDNLVTCTACPAGYTGRYCDTCTAGYSGNPRQLGDYCKIEPTINCNCDARGIVPNTQCDESTLQCQCKPYVQGLRCARCREGYFYLESNNPQGCLTCFCSGITNQCTSSNYYRDSLRPQLGSDDSHNFVLMNRRMNNIISDGFVVDSARNQITYNRFEGVQQERESLFFQLPPKFRGDRVSSYGGYLRFTLEFSARPSGRMYRDVDFEIISSGQSLRLYYLFEPSLQEGQTQTYEILLRENSFNDLRSNSAPTRETFMTILSNIEGILIRATYHENMASVTLRDVTMDTAVATPTNLGGAPMVEDCRCPEGYTGLSCQRCAQGYLRVSDGRGGLGRCVRCNCNGHATSCDPDTGRCLECQHNTEGDRCERCLTGYYGDATSGTPNDCRACPCPLTTSPNQFSPSCYLAEDSRVTCDRCPTGYTGRQCQTCAEGYIGEPSRPGGSCRLSEEDRRPAVNVSPLRVEEPEGSTAVFQCQVNGDGPFNVVWSRLDRRPLPDRATTSPNYALTIRNLVRGDSAKYICTATNRYGVTSRDVELKVIYGQTPLQVRIDRTRVEIEEGRTVRFVCTITGATGDMTYILSWSRQNGRMPSKAIDQNGVLVIPNIQRSDAGNYECTGSDMFTVDQEVAVLIVTGSTDEQAPSVRIEPRYQEVDEGTPVRFQCVATGEPKPRVEWYRAGDREMNPNAVITADGEFRIPRVTTDDESDYFCRATNDIGTAERRTILYVKKVDRPSITIIVRQTKYVTVAGDTARLECYVEDTTGRVTLFWSRPTGLPTGSSQDRGILTIPNVQPSYAGNYVCTGTDTESGRVSTAVAVLEVTVDATEPPKVRLEPEKITIPMGTTGTLRCQVTGSPAPVVSWLKSREELSANHQVNGNVLRITQATMADRGIYVCRAENSAGIDQDWTVVEVERRMRPKVDIYPNTTQVVAVGGSALFQCRVMDGDPPPTVQWTRVGGLPLPEGKVEIMENGVIMFKQVTQSEQGGYICTAENDMGSTSSTATLIVEGPPSIIIQPSKTVYALIGQRVTLECTADGDPTPGVYWVEPPRIQRGDVPLESPEEAPLSSGNAVLDIASVQREDQGTYTCVARNTGGETRDRVQLIIREGDRAGVTISGPSTLSVVDGQSVELVCSANQLRNPLIRWRRREGSLPPGHSVRQGVLSLPRFRAEYAGEYICTTSIQQQTYEASVFIIVTVAPRLTISPQRIATRAGDTIQLRCTASGSGPFDIEWSRVDAQINPSATERDGVLEIRQVTAADAGRYRCVVRSSTAGSSEGFALVVVEVPPSIAVAQRSVYTDENRNVELRCDASGSPPPVVSWEKEGGQLPAQHRIRDGVLTIYGVRDADAGRYICTASSSSGSSRDYAVLNVNTGSTIDNSGANLESQIVNVGDRVSLECIVTGTPLPTITWSRDDGPLPDDAVLGDGILIIPQAKIEDAGTYTCLAVNEAGSFRSKIVLYVKAQPSLSAPSTASAALGDRATLVCDAGGYPSPDITWYRKDGSMPSDYTIVDGDLVISRVRQEDAGTYVCHAENQHGQTDTPVNLNVGALVPRFVQDPNSYMAYSPLNDVYLDFDILLSLKPESTEGMVLYNGQFEDGGGDFVCFGLNEGYPEFRFDVGSGPAIIRGNKTLGLNEWHTIQLTRNKKKGSMVVNEQPAYTGESPGYFTGLDLEGKMYLGSVPNYDQIPRVAGFKEGFVGSISEVKIKGIDLNLGEEALEIVGVEPYNGCRNQPCGNGGTCVSANTRYGFQCICAQGYTGSRCQEVGERCYPGACGGRGRCYNLESGYGFRCICPIGKTGTGCQADVPINYPFFNRTSFISYPAAEDTLFALTIKLEYKPHSLSDGIILYEGNDKDGTGDFMALVQKDGYLEFRFDTGSGPAIIRSRTPLRVDEWTRVMATRKNREGTLVVNDDEPVTASGWPGTSPGSTVGLNLKLPLFLGGSDPTIPVSTSTGVNRGFIGCVAELTVNDRKYDLLNDAIESVNIVDCGERRLCQRLPCRNNGVCEDLPGPDYRCLCPASHTGKFCEIEINICLTNSPCQNGAPCSITNEGYRCDCPLGFAGDNCERAIVLDTQFKFEGDGFLELTKDLLPHAKSQERQTMAFSIRTTQSDGLIMWQGEVGGRPLRGGDHIALGLKGGYVEFSYEMGSGPATILSNQRVDDGRVHLIAVERLGRSGTLTVDNNQSVYGESLGYLQMLNADGNIYIGGVSAAEIMTDGKYTDNFIGCIDSINIHGKGPLESRDAISGFNVQPCSP